MIINILGCIYLMFNVHLLKTKIMKNLIRITPMAHSSIIALLPRIILALVFFFHGSQKMFGWFDGPGLEKTVVMMSEGLQITPLFGYLATFTEFFGAIFLILGFLTRISAAGLAITMAVAIITVHPDAFLLQNNGMEYALTLLVMSVISFLLGSGKVSLDALLFGRK